VFGVYNKVVFRQDDDPEVWKDIWLAEYPRKFALDGHEGFFEPRSTRETPIPAIQQESAELAQFGQV